MFETGSIGEALKKIAVIVDSSGLPFQIEPRHLSDSGIDARMVRYLVRGDEDLLTDDGMQCVEIRGEKDTRLCSKPGYFLAYCAGCQLSEIVKDKYNDTDFAGYCPVRDSVLVITASKYKDP
ncbi:hypothetical protein KBD45_03125 [Candidatus Dojkabacteria bacterium]|nr:hypothetical protein [Candidatus Dojkabacteria bacterium]